MMNQEEEKSKQLPVKVSGEQSILKSVKSVCPYLTERQRNFIEAGYGTRICDLPINIVLRKFLQFFNRAYLETGQLPPGYNNEQSKKLVVSYAGLLYKSLKLNFPYVKVEEVDLAIRNGILYKYGKYDVISSRTFYLFVDQYLEDQDRKAAILKQREFLNQEDERKRKEATSKNQKKDR